jgi:hypothetical protein
MSDSSKISSTVGTENVAWATPIADKRFFAALAKSLRAIVRTGAVPVFFEMLIEVSSNTYSKVKSFC